LWRRRAAVLPGCIGSLTSLHARHCGSDSPAHTGIERRPSCRDAMSTTVHAVDWWALRGLRTAIGGGRAGVLAALFTRLNDLKHPVGAAVERVACIEPWAASAVEPIAVRAAGLRYAGAAICSALASLLAAVLACARDRDVACFATV
jgi:hypothetical protein